MQFILWKETLLFYTTKIQLFVSYSKCYFIFIYIDSCICHREQWKEARKFWFLEKQILKTEVKDWKDHGRELDFNLKK